MTLRRGVVAVVAIAVMLAVGAPAGAAPSPHASCAAHVTHGEGPPGSGQVEHRFDRFGLIVSHVARAPGTSFEECLPALLEVLP
jgi:hypothetical protein